MSNTVAWQRWTENGYSLTPSKEHIVQDENSGATLCGREIPQEGNGLEYTEFTNGYCKKCQNIIEKINFEEAAQ